MKTELAYIELHAGPKFELNKKLSHLLTTVFVTLFFGFSIPILYPIALIGLSIFYYTDLYMIFYVYRMPPTYDEKINKGALRMLEYAPFYSLVMAIW